MAYYQRLRDLREDKDLTQAEVAKVINTTYQYYSKYEAGVRPIPFERVIELAKFYGVSLDYIAGLTNDKRGIGYKEKEPLKVKQKNTNNSIGIINIGEVKK